MIFKARKRPLEVEALYIEHDSLAAALGWMMMNDCHAYLVKDGIVIPTMEGDMRAAVGDYLLRGTSGEFYPCKYHIFHQVYEDK